jgi:imidazolonepropionase-like amidohydrolase
VAGASLLVHSVDDQPVDEEFLRLARRNRTIYCPTLTVVDGYWKLFDAIRARRVPTIDDPNGAVDSLTRAHIAETASLGPARLGTRRVTSDSSRTARLGTMADNLRRVWLAGIPIATGTDAGNPLTLHGPAIYAEMEAMQQAGLPPVAVINASTHGGAAAMNKLAEWGTAERGKAADLLVVSADPTRDVANLRQVRYVVRGGVVRGSRELRVH